MIHIYIYIHIHICVFFVCVCVQCAPLLACPFLPAWNISSSWVGKPLGVVTQEMKMKFQAAFKAIDTNKSGTRDVLDWL